MFHHVVLFRLRPGITLERVRRARERLGRLAETLPGVLHFSVTHNVAAENGGYTLALFSAFESEQAYEIFIRHPDHQRVLADDLDSVVEGRLVAQGHDEPVPSDDSQP
ncbi:MAG TPA: Dabb family protein [Planctomycetota bacterium]|nr:Dabb family protein [Planctomycetota bacterium]